MAANLTRERLLTGARATIRSRGYSETSVDDLAHAAGLTKGAVYSQFTGKTDLLLGLIDQWLIATLGRLRRSRHRGSAALVDFALADAHGEWGEILPDFWRQAIDDGDVREHLAEAYEEIEGMVAGIVATIDNVAEPASTTSAVIALHDGLVALAAVRPGRGERVAREEVERYIEDILTGRPNNGLSRSLG